MHILTASMILKMKLNQADKQQHFWYSFFILFSLYLFGQSVQFALAITLFIGLCKEIWDHCYGSGFCWFDMIANITGAAFAILCAAIVVIIPVGL
jgi:hypothetical protein